MRRENHLFSGLLSLPACASPKESKERKMKIHFKNSGKTLEWISGLGNILDLAEANGIQIESACRVGACGTCQVKLLSGDYPLPKTVPDF